ncbi:MAG: ATP-binding protein [Bacteroidota bacterium]
MSETEQNIDLTKIKADPSKDFFITMLVKDITLRDAIGDLVDNAVDAIKSQASNPESLANYKIQILLDTNSFQIKDNGSGMEAEVARRYAFNFGKSTDRQLTKKSIGQFGIGMKRAFFKLGSNIHIKSIAPTSKFELTIDVNEWQKDKGTNWQFEFDKGTLEENLTNGKNHTGLNVVITKLSADSTVSFGDKTFIDRLQKEIALEHMLNINKGLTIEINGVKLTANQITLVNDATIKPTYWEKNTPTESVKIIAGISAKDADDGGWYIFCNDRLIVAKDQTDKTVWTGSKGDGVPRYHAQYHRFRGYTFFEANDSSMLPWNTTKTGMDMDSPYYKEVRSKMINMTRQVMDLLDKLKEEKEKGNPEDSQTLNKEVERSLNSPKPVLEVLKETVNLNSSFHYPKALFNPIKKSKAVRITYQVSPERLEAVKQSLGESNPNDIGLKTFDYYYDNEI